MTRVILLVCIIASAMKSEGQELFLDSLLTQPLSKATFDPERWYWTELTSATDNQFLQITGWGKVIVYSNGSEQITGTMVPMSKKTYASYENILPLMEGKYLMKVKGEHPLFELESNTIRLLSSEEWRLVERRRLISHGLFFGILIVMALYNLMIYFAVKDQSYLWYVLSIIGFGLYMAFYYGFTIEYIWPDKPYWNATFFALIIPLTNLARIQFARTYLHTEEYVPKWNGFFKVLLILYLLPIIMWLANYLGVRGLLNSTELVIGSLGAITMTAITIVSVVVYLKGYKPALWFLVAFVLFNIGGILFIFRELEYLTDNFFTKYIIQIGAVVQVVLFSLGLSDRLNRTRKMLAKQTIEKEKLALERETERKELIEKQKNELEIQVRDRTSELESALNQLKVSESELRELNEVKSKLFSIVSHELKSPLTTVDSYLNLLIKHAHKLSKEELSDLSDKTRFSLQNLTRLMDNLLLWSQLQQDNLTFDPVKIDLRRAVDKSIKLFQPLLDQKKIYIEIGFQVDEMLLFADKEMLHFVIRNLIHNAIKFTPKDGHITIKASTDQLETVIHVKDSGIGMPPKLISQLLEQGISNTRNGTEHEKGSGVGLLLCKDFVVKNGGRLDIASNKGTTVSFSVPKYARQDKELIKS